MVAFDDTGTMFLADTDPERKPMLYAWTPPPGVRRRWVAPAPELVERADAFRHAYHALCEQYGATVDLVDYDELGICIGDVEILKGLDDDREIISQDVFEPEEPANG